LGGSAVWPVTARAQQTAMPVIGFVSVGSPQNSTMIGPFRRGLRDAGYVEGQNVTLEIRFGETYEQLPSIMAELVGRRVSVIQATSTLAAIAARKTTQSIPIVFVVGDDPIKNGLVTSFNRPGGNATGVTAIAIGLEGKRLGLLRELVPGAEL